MSVTEAYHDRVALDSHLIDQRTRWRQAETIVAGQRPAGQTLAHRLFVMVVHIERVATIGAHHHARVWQAHELTLRVAEPWP